MVLPCRISFSLYIYCTTGQDLKTRSKPKGLGNILLQTTVHNSTYLQSPVKLLNFVRAPRVGLAAAATASGVAVADAGRLSGSAGPWRTFFFSRGFSTNRTGDSPWVKDDNILDFCMFRVCSNSKT